MTAYWPLRPSTFNEESKAAIATPMGFPVRVNAGPAAWAASFKTVWMPRHRPVLEVVGDARC